MNKFWRSAELCFLCSVCALSTAAQTSMQIKPAQSLNVTVTEPGRPSIQDLFEKSDVVAVVRSVSGDTESYEMALYKGVVVSAFKGTASGAFLVFGPYTGGRLGMESVLFLRKVKSPAVPKDAKSAPYGTVNYYEVFNEGYSQMEIAYQCTFAGNSIKQNCDYGVRVCTDYIVLPKGTQTAPVPEEEAEFGCRWVRRSEFEDILAQISHPNSAAK